MKRKIVICLVCLICSVVTAFLISGCSENNHLDTGSNQQKEQQSNQAEEQGENAKEDCIVITTDFGTLYYPDQWTECVKINQSATENALTVSFDAVINDRQYPLFDVVIGQDDGMEVGQLTDNSGTKHTVYLHVDELQEDPDLTDGEQNRLYAMQEDLNYLIDNLK